MDQGRAQTLVVTAGAVSGVLVVIGAAKSGTKPTTRQVVGIGVATLGLSAAATLASPDLAGALALLWVTSSVFIYGGPAVDALRGVVSPGSKPLTTTAARPAPTTLST